MSERSRQIDLPIEAEEADQLFGRLKPFGLVVAAVSGGPDSMALMALLADWRDRQSDLSILPKIVVVTVDHQLRPEAAAEATMVGRVAEDLGLEHHILSWSDPKPASGVMEAAREERYRQLLRFGESHASADGRPVAIVTAHHQDDQAETVLMRLARGSGVKGLSGMLDDQGLDSRGSVRLIRPLLDVPKARLVATVHARDVPTIEDPTNSDPRYERARLRAAEAALNDAGITAPALSMTARRMQDAEDAIKYGVHLVCDRLDLTRNDGVFVSVDRSALCDAPRLLRQRVLEQLIGELRGTSEPPTLAELERLADTVALNDTGRRTLAGTEISWGRRVRIWREMGRLTESEKPLADGASTMWDGRFVVSRNGCPGLTVVVRPLGRDGVRQGREGQNTKFSVDAPERALYAVPSFWVGDRLVAAPQWESFSRSKCLENKEFSGLELISRSVRIS